MKILTVDNKTYELDDIPDTIEDLRYSILDYSNPVYRLLFYTISIQKVFMQCILVLKIGEHSINNAA